MTVELADDRRDLVTGRPAPPLPPPPLKWAGGKRWQVPILQPYWARQSHRRLVEPFCGGLAVALGLAPARALLNDVNPHLINFYRQLQRGLRVGRRGADKTHYYRHRQQFNRLVARGASDTPEAASLFYYLNRHGYNGLCRFNRRGEFNVPHGRYKTVQYHLDLTPYAAALAGWEFLSRPFAEVPLEPDDFVYADPPYDVEFTQYSQHEFGWTEQQRTAEWLATHPGPVILSNQATTKILELYGDLGYRLERYDAPRRISCNGDRAPASEVLAFRNLRHVDP
jgi:DNA adenine methylase